MKIKSLITVLVIFLTMTAGTAFCERGTYEQGENLFNDPGFGGSANDRSCATCHPEGAGLDLAGIKPDLATIINACIKGPLQGKAIEEDSLEMDALIRFIKSL